MSKARWKIASDGLRARINRRYALGKLDYLERYLIRGLSVAGSKAQRVYVDLFAGPGLNIDPDSGEEFESGALRALQLTGDSEIHAPFTDAFLVNLDPADHSVLTARVDRLNTAMQLRVPRHRVHVLPGDANSVVASIMQAIDPGAFVFVFADIEGVSQLPFRTVSALKQTKRHRSVDLYVLFPLHMAINRNLSYTNDVPESVADHMTAFFGTDAWRAIHRDQRVTDAQGPGLRSALQDLYLEQLRSHWLHVEVVERVVMTGRRELYRMILATSNAAASRVATGVAVRRAREGVQPGLFDL